MFMEVTLSLWIVEIDGEAMLHGVLSLLDVPCGDGSLQTHLALERRYLTPGML